MEMPLSVMERGISLIVSPFLFLDSVQLLSSKIIFKSRFPLYNFCCLKTLLDAHCKKAGMSCKKSLKLNKTNKY